MMKGGKAVMVKSMEHPRRVLIVDDQANWRELFRDLLEKQYDVNAAAGYMEALDMVKKRNSDKPFHAAVVDIRLDDTDAANEDGLALIGEINRLSRFTNVIVVTGYSTIRTTKKAIKELKVYDYLEKYPEDGRAFDHNHFLEKVVEAADDAHRRQQPFVFVVTPFARRYKVMHEHVVKKVVEREGLVCIRADDLFEPGRIIDDIKRSIQQAYFIIADLSGRSPNVFYEIGLAHALGKSVMLLTQAMEDVPPKLRDVRLFQYKDSLEGAGQLEKVLRKTLQILKQKDEPDVPLFTPCALETDPRLCVALMAAAGAGKAAFQQIVKVAAESFGFSCVSAQGIFSTRNVMEEIWEQLNRARLVIADLSDKDPDVFYLTGICHGLEKEVILMARNPGDIPFDLRGPSHVVYSDKTLARGLKAREKLTTVIAQVMKRREAEKLGS
jgi:ActR/RegA family two-component response regulator